MTEALKAIRDNGEYIPATVHYNKRAYDKKFEIVGLLPPKVLERMGLSIGGEVVLAVTPDRKEALDIVRFLRGHKQGSKQ